MADPVGRTLYHAADHGSEGHLSGHPAFGCLRGITEVVRPPQGICLLGRSPVVPWGGEAIYMNTNHGPHLLAGTGSPPVTSRADPDPSPAASRVAAPSLRARVELFIGNYWLRLAGG